MIWGRYFLTMKTSCFSLNFWPLILAFICVFWLRQLYCSDLMVIFLISLISSTLFIVFFCKYGYTDVYYLDCNQTLPLFNLFFKFFQLWSLGVLSSRLLCPFIMPHPFFFLFCKYLLSFRYHKMLPPSSSCIFLVSALEATTLQGVPVLFIGEWYLETKSRC